MQVSARVWGVLAPVWRPEVNAERLPPSPCTLLFVLRQYHSLNPQLSLSDRWPSGVRSERSLYFPSAGVTADAAIPGFYVGSEGGLGT